MSLNRFAATLFSFSLLVAAAPQSATETKTGDASMEGRSHDSSHVLVQLDPGTDPDRMLRGSSARHLFGRWYKVAVRASESPESALLRFASLAGVSKVELDRVLSVGPVETSVLQDPAVAGLFTPNDPQWGLQWNMPIIRMEEAWPLGTGLGATIAVVDSGVSSLGSDLDCHTYRSPFNAITNMSGPGVAEDDYGHGTHVAGTSVQCTDNGIGVAGVAYEAELMPIKVLDDRGNGDESEIATGIVWAVDQGADVINLSLGGICDAPWPECNSEILDQAIDHAVANDVLVMAAAGNNSHAFISFPANHPDVVPVAAVDMLGEPAWYSNFDQGMFHSHLLAAPGGDLSQTFDWQGQTVAAGVWQETLATFCGSGAGTLLCSIQGTSMATPHVAGAAAILKGLHPEASRDEILQALKESALDLGTPGYDPFFGNGLLQVDQAIAALDNLLGIEPFTCVPGENVLCITAHGDTYEVTMDWERDGNGGKAEAVDLGAVGITQGGAMTFFDPSNPELLIKILNFCSIGGSSYAVFYSATTDVKFELRVRQASSGKMETYTNEERTPAPPVQDSNTVFTCP